MENPICRKNIMSYLFSNELFLKRLEKRVMKAYRLESIENVNDELNKINESIAMAKNNIFVCENELRERIIALENVVLLMKTKIIPAMTRLSEMGVEGFSTKLSAKNGMKLAFLYNTEAVTLDQETIEFDIDEYSSVIDELWELDDYDEDDTDSLYYSLEKFKMSLEEVGEQAFNVNLEYTTIGEDPFEEKEYIEYDIDGDEDEDNDEDDY